MTAQPTAQATRTHTGAQRQRPFGAAWWRGRPPSRRASGAAKREHRWTLQDIDSDVASLARTVIIVFVLAAFSWLEWLGVGMVAAGVVVLAIGR